MQIEFFFKTKGVEELMRCIEASIDAHRGFFKKMRN